MHALMAFNKDYIVEYNTFCLLTQKKKKKSSFRLWPQGNDKVKGCDTYSKFY